MTSVLWRSLHVLRTPILCLSDTLVVSASICHRARVLWRLCADNMKHNELCPVLHGCWLHPCVLFWGILCRKPFFNTPQFHHSPLDISRSFPIPFVHHSVAVCMFLAQEHLQALKLGVITFGIVFECTCNCLTMCSNTVFAIELQTCVCRVDDYWLGYKLYCYAYYAHSFQHEAKFRQSKLGWWMVPRSLLQ